MYYLGKTSLTRCYRLHPMLAACVALAVTDCEVDFTASETVITPERQKELLAQKKTWTLNSKHLKQSDGLSHAVDLVPLVSVSNDKSDHRVSPKAGIGCSAQTWQGSDSNDAGPYQLESGHLAIAFEYQQPDQRYSHRHLGTDAG